MNSIFLLQMYSSFLGPSFHTSTLGGRHGIELFRVRLEPSDLVFKRFESNNLALKRLEPSHFFLQAMHFDIDGTVNTAAGDAMGLRGRGFDLDGMPHSFHFEAGL